VGRGRLRGAERGRVRLLGVDAVRAVQERARGDSAHGADAVSEWVGEAFAEGGGGGGVCLPFFFFSRFSLGVFGGFRLVGGGEFGTVC